MLKRTLPTYVMIITTLMALSSTNWFMIWFSMELNLLAFIPILVEENSDENESTIIYFLSQALGSAIFLMSTTLTMTFSWHQDYLYSLIIVSLLLKLGAAPFHLWYPTVMKTTSWKNCIILSTWQKIIPLFILLFYTPSMYSSLMMWVACLNAMVGGLMGLSQSSVKSLMAYSSITHMGWTLSSVTVTAPCLGVSYFITYSIMVIPLFMTFCFNQINISSKTESLKMSKKSAIILVMMLLSLGGMPPFTGFCIKLLLISYLVERGMTFATILILGSIMNLFFYMNFIMKVTTSPTTNKEYAKITWLNILALNMFGPFIMFF